MKHAGGILGCSWTMMKFRDGLGRRPRAADQTTDEFGMLLPDASRGSPSSLVVMTDRICHILSRSGYDNSIREAPDHSTYAFNWHISDRGIAGRSFSVVICWGAATIIARTLPSQILVGKLDKWALGPQSGCLREPKQLPFSYPS